MAQTHWLTISIPIGAVKRRQSFRFAGIRLISIPIGAVKSSHQRTCRERHHRISIPIGAVKSGRRDEHTFELHISIPIGAVKSPNAAHDEYVDLIFQFQSVRLKVSDLTTDTPTKIDFNSNRCG